MKNLTLIIALLSVSFALPLYGQWTTSGTTISYNAGNVSIGGLSRSPLEVSTWGDNNSISTALTISQQNTASPNNKSGVALAFGIGNNYSNNGIYGTITVKETYWSTKPKMIFSLRDGASVLTDRVYINWDGNVGIGQDNPVNKLEVNGTAHAKEVKVDMTGWSDFVFDKSYYLLPLTDLEKFIEKNHHLPEVPTTSEVLQNGIELGAMNATLLKKIEEITLYMIQQQKTIEEQSKRITDLEQQNSKK